MPEISTGLSLQRDRVILVITTVASLGEDQDAGRPDGAAIGEYANRARDRFA